MKKIIVFLSLTVMLGSCSKSFEERKADYKKCADKEVAKFDKKMMALPETEQFAVVTEDVCKFNKIQDKTQCQQAIIGAMFNGTLEGAINEMVYRTLIVPACGEYPVESKEPKNK